MKLSNNTQGFSGIVVLVIIGVIGIIGLVGYNVYSQQQARNDNNSSSNTAAKEQASDSDEAPEITKTEDLTTAEKSIDSVNIDSSSDETQLNSNLAF